jgi:hypothetical protein
MSSVNIPRNVGCACALSLSKGGFVRFDKLSAYSQRALLSFNRLSTHCAAALLLAYALGLSLARRDCDHDREAFCGLATDLFL